MKVSKVDLNKSKLVMTLGFENKSLQQAAVQVLHGNKQGIKLK
jgi:hypothetical protein